jgi:hypothetical protein
MVTDVTDAVTAVATWAAVATALGLAVVPAMWRRRRRPRLAIGVGGEPPLLVLVPSPTNPQEQVLRVSVTNEGRSGARRVRAQTVGVWFRGNQGGRPTGDWESLVDLPIWLTWESRHHDDTVGAEVIDLAPGMTDHVTLITKDMSDSLEGYGQFLVGQGVEDFNQRLYDAFMRVGEFCIGVAAYSDDADPVVTYLHYRTSLAAKQLTVVGSFNERPTVRAPVVGDLGDVFKGPPPSA